MMCVSQTIESTESAQVHFLSSKNVFLGTECVLEKGMCFRVHVVHSSELMLFSGLFASLIFQQPNGNSTSAARTGQAKRAVCS